MSPLLHELLEASARATPTATAVVDGDRELDYAELDRRADRVAACLRRVGVGHGDLVGLHLEKSIEAVVGIYGVLKANAAYVPLDTTSPPTRLRYVVEDAQLRVVLTAPDVTDGDSAATPAWATGETPVEHVLPVRRDETAICGSVPAVGGEREPDSAQDSVGNSALAYVLYTSGSTGHPKGVKLSHRNATAFVQWAVGEFGLGPGDRMANHAPLHFDLSILDVFGAAAAGASLVLVPSTVSVFPHDLANFIRSQRISVWYSVPSVLVMLEARGGLAKRNLPDLRLVLFAGEVFPLPPLRRLMDRLQCAAFYNLFGPTETNVCLSYRVPCPIPESWSTLPIGQPVTGVECFALTEDGRPVAEGEAGELWVRGPTVMHGYVGDGARTDHVLTTPPGQHVPAYRTGDIVRRDVAGTWFFVGRRDGQIKSRGYRIEMGEVEATLGRHPAVLECAVVAVPDEFQGNRLAAFAVTDGGTTEKELLAHCRSLLPSYMVPNTLRLCETLPRTSNGKINHRALTMSPMKR